MYFQLQNFKDYWRASLPASTKLNERLLFEFEQASQKPAKQSHFFSGRYENIYITPGELTDLAPLLMALHQTASRILKRPLAPSTSNHWFNRMQPGHITGLHTHDHDNELISAVYYLKVPRNSGNLVLHASGKKIIRPKAGEAIFFSPALPHEVTRNDSDDTRLSLALNYGPVRLNT